LLSYFKINDPYRLVVIFILLFALSIPAMIKPEVNTIPELERLLIGQSISNGKLLYDELWVEMAPLSSVVYSAVDWLFGRSYLAHKILAILLFFFQIFYFNQTLLSRKAYNENSYVPAFLYAVLGFIMIDTIRLSAELMGLTFIVVSFASLFKHLEARVRTDQNLLYIGIYIGIASLFYLPYLAFFLATVLSLLFYTNTMKRRYVLLIYGVAFPILLVWIYYFIIGKTDAFYFCYINSLIRLDYFNFLDLTSVLIIIALPSLYLLWAFIKVFNTPSFINYQSRIQGVFFFYFLTAVVVWIFWSRNSGATMAMFIPIYTFFLSHLFLLIRKWLVREIATTLLIASIFTIYFASLYGNKLVVNAIDLKKLLVQETSYDQFVQGKSLLVMGKQYFEAYQSAAPATPYLDWQLARAHFDHLNYYDHLQKIYVYMEEDPPEMIIDESNYMPELSEKIPLFKNQYEKVSGNLYRKITHK
jgi:hypothetical protein